MVKEGREAERGEGREVELDPSQNQGKGEHRES